MGRENTSRASSDRRAFFGNDVYDTAHIMSEIPKCRPRIARCDNWSSSLPVKTTSSTRIKIFRLSGPASSCC